jgi:tetratricopeptide (TPR) repeat protein
VIERLYESSLEERAAEIVNHLRASGARDRAAMARMLALAGERAIASAAFGDAAAYFEEALEFAGDEEDEPLARILVGLGHAHRSSQSLELAMPHWRRALAIYERLGDKEAIAGVAYGIAMQVGWDGRWDEVLEITARALAFVGEAESGERALLQGFAAVGLGWAGEYEASKAMLDETIALSQRLQDPLITGQGHVASATHAYAYGQIDDCVENSRRAVEMLEEAPLQWAYATAQAFLVFAMAFGGRFSELPKEVEKLEQVSKRLGFGGGLMFAHRCRMLILNCTDPNPQRWLAMAEADLELCRTYDLPWAPQAELFIATARAILDELDEAVATSLRATEAEPAGALYGWGLGMSMLLLAYAGRHDEARALWERVEPFLPSRPGMYAIGRWNSLGFVVEALWWMGEFERLAPYYEAIASAPRDNPMRWDGRSYDAVTGLAAAAAGRWDDAERYFLSARSHAERLPNETEKYWVRHLHALVLLERGAEGDLDRAMRLLTEALDGLTRLDLPLYRRMTREKLDSIA